MSPKLRQVLTRIAFAAYALSFLAPNSFGEWKPGGWYLFVISWAAIFISIQMAIPLVLLQFSNLGTMVNLLRFGKGRPMNKPVQIFASLSAFAWIPFFHFRTDVKGAFGPSFCLWAASITLLAISIPGSMRSEERL